MGRGDGRRQRLSLLSSRPGVLCVRAQPGYSSLRQVRGSSGPRLRRPLEQEAEVGGDERVGRRHRVGVVNGPVLAREGDPARGLAEAVLQLGPDLPRPLHKPVRRVVDHLLHLGNLWACSRVIASPKSKGKSVP